MQIFPYFLSRVGGAPIDLFSNLNIEETFKTIDAIHQLKMEQEKIVGPLCDKLHEIIHAEQDNKIQNKLLNIKRSIFNKRILKQSDVDQIQSLLSAEILEGIQQYLKLQEDIKQQYEVGKAVFTKELIASRNQLKKVSTEENFQKGLLLSSQPLLNNIDSYIERNPAELRKKELKTEESLLKYLSRMCAKTSPFSTFTNLSLGEIVNTTKPATEKLSAKTQTERVVKSHICLNNNLFAVLKAVLLKLPDLSKHFPIRPNPTISLEQDNYLFLTNSNNIEAFQRIPHNPVVELFYELTHDKIEGVTFQQLITEIIENEYFDATEEEIGNYINQLINYGFLEYNVGVSGIDPFWDYKLIEVMGQMTDKSSYATDVIEAVKRLRHFALEYEKADLQGRRSILKQAYDEFKASFYKLHEAAGLSEQERMSPEELAKWQAEEREKLKKEAEKKEAEKKEEEAKAEETKSEEAKSEEAKVEESTEGEKTEGETENSENPEAAPNEVFMHRTNTYFHFKPEQIFYEDTTVNVIPEISREDAMQVVEPISDIINSLNDFDALFDEMEKMTDFFLGKYGEDKSIPVMNFYEDYFRDIKIPEAERLRKFKEEKQKEAANKEKAEKEAKEKAAQPVAEAKPEEVKDVVEEKKEEVKEEPKEENKTEAPKEIEATKLRHNNNKERTDKFAMDLVKDKEKVISIDINDFSGLKGDIPFTDKISSFGAFTMFYEEEGRLKTVCTAVFPGFGKMFSRFLHILDNHLTGELRAWNSPDESSEMFIEDCDASFFNANLHPPLMPYEIWMPGGQNTLPPEQQVPITELEIKFNKAQNKLNVLHKKTGKETYIFDLGFQGNMGRSQLFQLLGKFTRSKGIFWGQLNQTLNSFFKVPDGWEKTKEPLILPRITLKDTVTIQRKTWMFRKDLVPKFEPTDTEWDFFCKVNLWRKKYGIPDEVFIYITNHNELEYLKPETRAKLGRDAYKPQYINFTNPILVVNLFDKLIERVPNGLKLEEMLPNSKQLLSFGGQKFVTEFMVQWYNNLNHQPDHSTSKSATERMELIGK